MRHRTQLGWEKKGQKRFEKSDQSRGRREKRELRLCSGDMDDDKTPIVMEATEHKSLKYGKRT